MKWWYENEEEKMPFMKWVKASDEYKPVEITDEEMFDENVRRRGKRAEVWLDEANEMAKREKERDMEFDRSRVFTSLNADELRAGDKVIVADTIHCLEVQVKGDVAADTICQVNPPTWGKRFSVGAGNISASLAYLVERAELKTEKSCTKCRLATKLSDGTLACDVDGYPVDCTPPHDEACSDYKPITKQKAEKHYRPFKDTDELIKVWDAKIGTPKWGTDGDLTMPHIWVRQKECSKGGLLITYFGEDEVRTDMGFLTMRKLLSDYTFADGSPCGVEE